MIDATERQRRFRQKRRARQLKAFEVWLRPDLVAAVKRDGESISALVARALDALRQGEPGTSGDTRPYEERKAALVARMQGMRAQGLSYQAVADRLNAEGVPPLGRGTRWHKGTVYDQLHAAEEAP